MTSAPHLLAVLFLCLAAWATVAESEPLFGGGLLLAGITKAAFIKGALVGGALGRGRGRRRHYSSYGGRASRRRHYSGGYSSSYPSYSRSYRGKRDADDNIMPEEVEQYFLKASVEDSNDCLKSFVCLAASLPRESREPLEESVVAAFGADVGSAAAAAAPAADPWSGAAEFELAASVGGAAGARQCRRLYARCGASYFQLREQLAEAWVRQQQQDQEPEYNNELH